MRSIGILSLLSILTFISGAPLLAQSTQKTCDVYAAHPSDDTNFERYSNFSELKKFADDAIRACEKAAKAGDPRFIFQLGRSYLAQGNEALAVFHYSEAEKLGHVLARFFLAEWKRAGKYGIRKDSAKALKMHKDIVNNHQGSKVAAFSAFWIGWMHHSKLEGVTKSIPTAKQYYEMSLKLGDRRGYYGLGFIHLRSRNYLDDAKALSFFEQSIKKTAFKRSDARKYAAELLLKDFNGSYDSDKMTSVRVNVTRALDHLSARRGKNKSFHREYLIVASDIHIKTMAVVLNEENVWGEIGSPESRQKLRNWHKETGKAFQAGLLKRLEIFPNEYPGKSSVMNKLKHIKDTIKKMENAAKQIKAERMFFSRKKGVKNSLIAKNCTSWDGEWHNNKYKVKVRNKCPIGVRIRLDLKVTYKSGRKENEVFNFSLPANGAKSKSIHGGKNAASGGQSVAICPDYFGDMKLNYDSGEKSYTCQRTEGLSLTNPHVTKWEKEIAKTLIELIGSS